MIMQRHALNLLLLILIISCAPKMYDPGQWEQEIRSIHDTRGNPFFTDREIQELRQSGTSVDFARELAGMRDGNGGNLFLGNQVSWFRNMGGTIAYAESLASLTDDNGNHPFSGFHIAYFRSRKISAADIEGLWNVRTGTGERLFTPKTLKEYADANGERYFARLLGRMRTSEDTNIFEAGQIIRLVETGAQLNHIEILAGLKRADGRNVFTGEEIVRFFKTNRPVAYAAALARNGFDGKSIYRFAQLGIDLDDVLDFSDTDRPNAVVLYARTDYNDEFETPESLGLFYRLNRTYDTWVRLVSRESDIYSNMGRIPDIELLWIAGHGSVQSITLDQDDNGNTDETLLLDTGDAELAEYLGLLHPDAVIFLDACDTGRFGDYVLNLAGFFRQLSDGRTVWASDDLFSHKQVLIEKVYPLRIRFKKREN